MCVPREALISALVARARAGDRVEASDVRALLEAGVSAARLRAAFAGDGEAMAHARGVVDAIVRGMTTVR